MKAYKGGKTSGKKESPDPNLLNIVQQYQKDREIIVRNESEHKYSAMLLELIKPYQSPKPDIDELDQLLYVAVIAWNVANMKKEMPFAYQIMLQETKDNFKGDKEAVKLLTKLITDKEKKFGAFELFIHDYEFKTAEDNEVIVSVRATTLETFLTDSLLEEEEEEKEGFDFEPAYINRNAFIVTPKELFIEWVKKVSGSSLLPAEMPEPNIYLVEEKYNNEELEAWVKKNFERIFTKELGNWYADKKSWPKKRTYQMFREWFDVSYHSSVYDLEDFPVDKDIL